MAWVRVESSVRTHVKFLAAGPAACWLWLCGLAYCQEGLTDGFIPTQALPHLGMKAPHASQVKLVAVGLWDEVPGGWYAHGYLEHNRSEAEVETIRQERRKAGGHGGAASWAPSGGRRRQQNVSKASATVISKESAAVSASTVTATATATEPKEERTKERSAALRARFERFWAVYPRKVGKDAAMRVWLKHAPDEALTVTMITAIQAQMPGWDDPKFIPHPGTWLHQGRWQDEPAGNGTRAQRGAAPMPTYTEWEGCPHVEAHDSTQKYRCQQATALGRPRKAEAAS